MNEKNQTMKTKTDGRYKTNERNKADDRHIKYIEQQMVNENKHMNEKTDERKKHMNKKINI